MRTLHVEDIDFIVLNLGYAQTSIHWGDTDISSSFARIYYVRKGRACLHLPTGDVEATPGHLYLVPPNVPHSYECEPEFGFYYLFVNPRMRTDIFDLYEYPTEVASNEAAQLLFDNYCRLYPSFHLPTQSVHDFDTHPMYSGYANAFAQVEPYEQLQLQGLVLIIFSYFQKRAKWREQVTDPRMMDLVTYIQEHVREPISIDSLAERACLTKSYLIRAFKESTGVSPLQYILRKKVQEAQSLLLTTPLSVAEVSHTLGMNDVSYFIRMFKKALGYTPMEYREKLR